MEKEKNNDWFINKELTNDEYSVLGTYKTGKIKIKLRKHEVCGSEFEMRPEDFEDGQRCPECAKL